MSAEAWTQSLELRNRAFAFLSEAGGCRDLADLHTRFLAVGDAFGFQKVCLIRLVRAGGPFEPEFIAGEPPQEWLARYMELDYGHIDPTIPMTFQSRQAFTWDKVEERHRTPEVRAFFGEARELFAKDSFVVPVWGPYGELSVVELMSDRAVSVGEDDAGLLQGLANLYATLALSLADPAPPAVDEQARALGRRELQCVYWMGMGKHDHEIATILDISPRTVRTYIDGARDKLGVASRPELIRKALTLGVLLPDTPALGKRRPTPRF